MARQGNAPATVTTAAVSLSVPPAVVTALEYWPVVVNHPVAAAALGLAGSAVLYAIGYVARVVWEQLATGPALRLAGFLGNLSAPRHRRRYLTQLRREALQLDRRGGAANVFGPLLDDIYVDVSLDRGWARQYGATLEASWADEYPGWTKRKGRKLRAGERASLTEFIAVGRTPGSNTLLVTGQPGAGKSAQLRHAALWACDGGSNLVPVLLRLRDHVAAITNQDEPPGLLDLVIDTPVMHRVNRQWMRRQLERRNCLVLLDGLDEVGEPETRYQVAQWIYEEMSRQPNVLVVTSRPEGFDSTALAGRGVPLNVRAFTVPQTLQFLTNWYRAMEARPDANTTGLVTIQAQRKAQELHTQFRRSPALYDLASRPLLLTMIASVHHYHGKLPGSRTELYRQMCDMLLWRQDNVHVHGALTQRQRAVIIQRFALTMMERDVETISERDSVEVVSGAMQRMNRPVRPQKFLRSMVYEGLLVVGLHGAFEFPHTTVKEYLAAACLWDQGKKPTAHVTDRRWHEVIKMWCAMSDASEVVEACLEIKEPETVWLAFECAREAHELNDRQRERLNDLRATGDVPTLIHIYDNLDATLTLGENSTVCASPVSETLRHEFLLELSGNRNYLPPPDTTVMPPHPKKAARGMWPVDVNWFLDWVNDHTDDDTTFRLPTVGELEDPAVTMTVDVSRTPVWITEGDRPRLHCHSSVTHSFRDSPRLLRDSLAADRQDTSGQLILALAFMRAVTLGYDSQRAFVSAGNGVATFPQLWPLARAFDRKTQLRDNLESARETGDAEQTRAAEDALAEFEAKNDVDTALATILKLNLAKFNVLELEPRLPDDLEISEVMPLLSRTRVAEKLAIHGIVPEKTSTVDYLAQRSYLLVLEAWLDRAREDNVDDPVRHFDEFLIAGVHGRQPGEVTVYPDEILDELDSALRRITAYSGGQRRYPTDVEWVLRRVREMSAPVLQRIVPYNSRYLPFVRIALAASCLACRGTPGLEHAADGINRALCGIDILAGRAVNAIVPTEVLLLARS